MKEFSATLLDAAPAVAARRQKGGLTVRVYSDTDGPPPPTEGYFKNRQKLELRATLPVSPDAADSAQEAHAVFSVYARCAHGGWSLWRLVQTLPSVPVDPDGCAAVKWGFAEWAQFNRWAFAEFRFVAVVNFTERRAAKRARLSSGIWRHYAATVGIYGFGPIGERFSNSEIRLIAEKIGAASIRFRQREALRKMAAQVAPSEQNMRFYGYSLGGRAAAGFARWLERRGIGVELLVGIDPVDLTAKSIKVPANVRRAISFYQRNGARLPLLFGPAGRGLPFAASDTERTAVNNRRIDFAPGGWAVMHEDAPRVLSAEVAALLDR